MHKKRILVIAFSNLHKDPRVIRQVKALENQYDLYTIGITPINNTIPNLLLKYQRNNIFWKLIRLLCSISGRLDSYLRIVSKQYILKQEIFATKFDLILCNDIDSLPLGIKIANAKVPVWADLHEYSPREFENSFLWKLFYQPYKEWLCKKFLVSANYITVVCKGIANEYENKFHVKTQEVITNASFYEEKLKPQFPRDTIKLIHHGSAMPNRKIEGMIDMMTFLKKDYALYLMLVANGQPQIDYINCLKKKAIQLRVNVYFLDPVPTMEIASIINRYDIGVYLLEPVGFNELYALPNKFFEFLQARLCLATSPNPEMAAIIKEASIGIVSDDYSPKSIAESIAKLSKDKIYEYKCNASREAWNYSADNNMIVIQHIANKLIEEFPKIIQ